MKYFYRLFAILIAMATFSVACTSTEAPTRTEVVLPTQTLVVTAAVPTNTPLPPPSPTYTPIPTATATLAPAPTSAPPTSVSQNASFGDNLYVVVNVAFDDVLNVRAEAGVSNEVVGTLPYFAHDVKIADTDGVMVGESQWVQVQYADVMGWVNRQFLARQIGVVDDAVAARAAEIIFAIKSNNVTALATMVHPEKGVRFSPYAFVSDEDLNFSAVDLPFLFASKDTHLWGYFDGSGEAIELSGANYWARFIYDANFAQPEIIGFNQLVGKGNTINNLSEMYPDGVFVEYYFSGFDPKYGGMDWRSLRLVLEEYQGQWFLVGVVHDEWTI